MATTPEIDYIPGFLMEPGMSRLPKIKKTGVYAIRNTISGRVYVGSTEHIPWRWKSHRHLLRHGKHSSRIMQRSWDKHGPDAFVFEILEECQVDQLLLVEQRWIDKLDAANPKTGFNVASVAGTRRGVPQPPSVAESSRRAHLGKPKSAETRAKISAGQKGRVNSPEQREQIRQVMLRRFSDPAARAAQSESRKLYFENQENRERNRASITAAMARPEVRAAISAKAALRAQDPEHRAILTENSKLGVAAMRKKMQDPEFREARSRSIRAAWTPELRAKRSAQTASRHAVRRANGLTKVSPADAEAMYRLYASGWKQPDIARLFCVDQPRVSLEIRRYRTAHGLPAITGRNVHRGSSHGMAKVSEADIAEIRRLYSTGLSQDKITTLFPVSQAQVSRIVRGESWQQSA